MWFIVWCGFKNRYHKDWTTCSKCRNHSRFSGQHNWGDLYDHLMSTRILISIMNMTFIWAHKIYEESDDTVKLDLLTISYYSRDSYPKRSGLLRKTNYLRPIYVSIIHYDPVFLQQFSIVIGLEWHFCMQYNNDICCYGQEAAWKSNMPTLDPNMLSQTFPLESKLPCLISSDFFTMTTNMTERDAYKASKNPSFGCKTENIKWRANLADPKRGQAW